jgi:hypothetical protein
VLLGRVEVLLSLCWEQVLGMAAAAAAAAAGVLRRVEKASVLTGNVYMILSLVSKQSAVWRV